MATVVSTTPVIMTTPAIRPGNKLYAKEFKILGVIQIMLGTLSIITWTYALTLELATYGSDNFVYISSGIWCGIFFLIAGILATVSSFNPNRCKGVRTSLATLHGFMAFFAIAELVVAIVHSVYCCKFSQTSNMAPQPVVQYTTTYPQTNFTGVAQQMPVTSIGQPIGGAYQNTVYPVTSVPYQAPYYANQVAPVSSPPMSPVATGMSTASGAQDVQPPPIYSEADKTGDNEFLMK
ncbi:uncharacterized protein LOC100179756 isoform X1 [Ciona intestinalis]